MPWLALSYSIPKQPSSSARVTLWRRLQRLGALPLTGAYILPHTAECLESFSWLAEEIDAIGGETLIMRVEHFEGLSDRLLIERFNGARAESYATLLDDIEVLATTSIATENSAHKEGSKDAEESTHKLTKALSKLRQRFSEIRRIDFFNSPSAREVLEAMRRLEDSLLPPAAEQEQVSLVDSQDFQRRTWVTRPQPHVDRMASIWLISRFIDGEARFVYRLSAEPDEVSFDMDEAIFGHTGSLCTFETLIAAFGLNDAALKPLIQIVHEMDLRDERYMRPEVVGLDALLDGWLASGLSDEELAQRGRQVFEALYIYFTEHLDT